MYSTLHKISYHLTSVWRGITCWEVGLVACFWVFLLGNIQGYYFKLELAYLWTAKTNGLTLGVFACLPARDLIYPQLIYMSSVWAQIHLVEHLTSHLQLHTGWEVTHYRECVTFLFTGRVIPIVSAYFQLYYQSLTYTCSPWTDYLQWLQQI